MTIKELIKMHGDVSKAHRWLIQQGLDLPYNTVRRWALGMKPSPAYAELLKRMGVEA